MSHNIKPGVATGDQVQEIFRLAKSKNFALPAVNVIGSSSINGVLETAKELNAPVIFNFQMVVQVLTLVRVGLLRRKIVYFM